MTPRQIIKAEYGNSRNLITPRRLGIGALPGGAYELSTGTGIDHEPIFGVTVVRCNASDNVARDIDASQMFYSREEARAYIRDLKAGRL